MTSPIEDVSSLPGRELLDLQDEPIGEIKAIYATEDGFPMWVLVEAKTGMTTKQTAFVPLARLKEEGDDELRVAYTKGHILRAPKPENDDEISEECDRDMRIYYSIGAADQEMWDDNKGYSTMVPEEFGASKRADDPDDLETPDADKRTDETVERARDPGSSELRDVDAQDVFEQGGVPEADDDS
jgi:hypothetical protein